MVIVTLICAALIVAADQITKLLVVNYIKPVGSVTVIPGILDFSYVENTGMAFGWLENGRWLFIVFTTLVLLAMLVYIIYKRPASKLLNLTVGFVLGGGIGNLIDRVLNGFVVDFLALSFFPPVCNVADYFVTAGTVMFFVYLIFFSDWLKSDKVKKDG